MYNSDANVHCLNNYSGHEQLSRFSTYALLCIIAGNNSRANLSFSPLLSKLLSNIVIILSNGAGNQVEKSNGEHGSLVCTKSSASAMRSRSSTSYSRKYANMFGYATKNMCKPVYNNLCWHFIMLQTSNLIHRVLRIHPQLYQFHLDI